MSIKPPSLPGQDQRDHPLAVVALVMACLSFILGPLTAIPAVICGHIASGACRRDQTLGGRTMAKAALVIGYVVLIAIALAVLGFIILVVAANLTH